MTFQLRNIPLLSRVGADRADEMRTDVDAAVGGWAQAQLLRVDDRGNVMVLGEKLLLGPAAAFADSPPADAVFLARAFLRNPHWALHAAEVLDVDVAWPRPYERARSPRRA